MPSHERDTGHEHEATFYSNVARFAGERVSGRAYGKLQAAIYARPDCDLSVYRIQLDRIYHVAVLGQTPPQELRRTIQRALAAGEPATLPPEVMDALIMRRIQQAPRGPWFEQHHRPGKRL